MFYSMEQLLSPTDLLCGPSDRWIFTFPFSFLLFSSILTRVKFVCSSLSSTDVGFILVIDRRQDRWAAVKGTLLRIAVSDDSLCLHCLCFESHWAGTNSCGWEEVCKEKSFPIFSHHCQPYVFIALDTNRGLNDKKRIFFFTYFIVSHIPSGSYYALIRNNKPIYVLHIKIPSCLTSWCLKERSAWFKDSCTVVQTGKST